MADERYIAKQVHILAKIWISSNIKSKIQNIYTYPKVEYYMLNIQKVKYWIGLLKSV